MTGEDITRRGLLAGAGVAAGRTPVAAAEPRGAQRLSLAQLRKWESLGYGMFIHFGMSTFVGKELPSGEDPPETYNPTRLDVDQWVQVARDAGMKYIILTAKHVAGHCLWPSRYTKYTVANSGNKTDVIEAFVRACERRKVLPALYYCSWDNHNLFGSLTPSQARVKKTPAYTTSLYQTFQTNQVTELLTNYGPIAEMFIDIPLVLGRGYRTFLYQHIASLQPECVVAMNSGISDQATYNVERNWPSDIIIIERRLPPESGYQKWRDIEGEQYYMPGEVCDTLAKEWFYLEGDRPKSDAELVKAFEQCRRQGVNFNLDVGPDKQGLITTEFRDALMRLRRNVKL